MRIVSPFQIRHLNKLLFENRSLKDLFGMPIKCPDCSMEMVRHKNSFILSETGEDGSKRHVIAYACLKCGMLRLYFEPANLSLAGME